MSPSGEVVPVSDGISALTVPNIIFEHDMKNGFPLLTTKKMGIKSIAAELEFFLKGLTDKRWLQDRKCHIWDEWCCPTNTQRDLTVSQKEWQRANPDLGPLGYSWQMRRFNAPYKAIPYVHGISKPTHFNAGYGPEEDINFPVTHSVWFFLLEDLYHTFKDSPYHLCNDWLIYDRFKQDFLELSHGKDYGELSIHPGEYKFCKDNCQHIYSPSMDYYPTYKTCDQLTDVLTKLDNCPYDRRIGVSYVNPCQAKDMALEPCHLGFRLAVVENTISLAWTQRSVDTFLGLPYNIASYALLLSLFAREFDLVPYKLTGLLVDCHLYENQIAQAQEQLSRLPGDLPNLKLETKSVLDWTYEDCELPNYKCHPPIKAEVVV
jgi:thymidylate synthase